MAGTHHFLHFVLLFACTTTIYWSSCCYLRAGLSDMPGCVGIGKGDACFRFCVWPSASPGVLLLLFVFFLCFAAPSYVQLLYPSALVAMGLTGERTYMSVCVRRRSRETEHSDDTTRLASPLYHLSLRVVASRRSLSSTWWRHRCHVYHALSSPSRPPHPRIPLHLLITIAITTGILAPISAPPQNTQPCQLSNAYPISL